MAPTPCTNCCLLIPKEPPESDVGRWAGAGYACLHVPMMCTLLARRVASLRAAAVTKLRSAELLRLGFVMALAMTLHNMPEGFAVRARSG